MTDLNTATIPDDVTPQAGGSYTRNPDGTLTKSSDPQPATTTEQE